MSCQIHCQIQWTSFHARTQDQKQMKSAEATQTITGNRSARWSSLVPNGVVASASALPASVATAVQKLAKVVQKLGDSASALGRGGVAADDAFTSIAHSLCAPSSERPICLEAVETCSRVTRSNQPGVEVDVPSLSSPIVSMLSSSERSAECGRRAVETCYMISRPALFAPVALIFNSCVAKPASRASLWLVSFLAPKTSGKRTGTPRNRHGRNNPSRDT